MTAVPAHDRRSHRDKAFTEQAARQDTAALPLSETAWTGRVIDIAKLHGWRVAHFRPAQTGKGWRTPMQGHIGVPDLLLARDGDVLCAELKSDRGRVLPDQLAWLDHLGVHGCVWRPRDLDAVLARLARKAGPA